MPKAKLVADLVSMKKNIRSILFGAKLKNVRVVDPATICATDDPENWEDTVHLRWEQYVKLAAGLSAMLVFIFFISIFSFTLANYQSMNTNIRHIHTEAYQLAPFFF